MNRNSIILNSITSGSIISFALFFVLSIIRCLPVVQMYRC